MEDFNLEQFIAEVESGKRPNLWYFFKRTEEQKQSAINEMKKTESFFKTEFNLDIYLIYGTLLGAIREKDFIAYDHDIDMAYLSYYNTKEEVLIEFKKIHEILFKKELLSKIFNPGHSHIWSPDKKIKIDLWTSWISNTNNYYLVPLIDGQLKSETILPLKKDLFKNILFNFPNKSEDIVSFCYKNWSIYLPDDWRKVPWKKII